MTGWEVGAGFGLGLAGSLHCIGMCGPLVLAQSAPMSAAAPHRQAIAHLSYNAGRIATYTVLGGLAGLAGQALGGVGRLAGVANTAVLTAGVLLVFAGLALAGLTSKRSMIRISTPRVSAAVSRAAAKWLQAPTIPSRLVLGLVLGLLPCGLVYAGLLNAVASGTAGDGALSMLAFGLGTAPALLGIGLASGTVARAVGANGPRVAAAAVVVTGVLLLWRGLMAGPVLCH